MLGRHHDEVQDIEYKNMAAIHKLRDEQLRQQHSTELTNQNEYTERQQKELRKRHALQTKQLPKSISVCIYQCLFMIFKCHIHVLGTPEFYNILLLRIPKDILFV